MSVGAGARKGVGAFARIQRLPASGGDADSEDCHIALNLKAARSGGALIRGIPFDALLCL